MKRRGFLFGLLSAPFAPVAIAGQQPALDPTPDIPVAVQYGETLREGRTLGYTTTFASGPTRVLVALTLPLESMRAEIVDPTFGDACVWDKITADGFDLRTFDARGKQIATMVRWEVLQCYPPGYVESLKTLAAFQVLPETPSPVLVWE